MGSAKDAMIDKQEAAAFEAVAKELGESAEDMQDAGMEWHEDRMNDGTLTGYYVDFSDEDHPAAKRVLKRRGNPPEISMNFFDSEDG